MLNRLTFALALLGIILTVHMWVQKQRGFDAGCLGGPAQTQTVKVSGCEEAMASESSTFFFGIDNVTAGFLFYAVLATTGLAMIFVSPKTAAILAKTRLVLAGAGFFYSIYLVYQLIFVLQTFCPLCTVSAVTVSLIFAIELYGLLKAKHPVELTPETTAREIGIYSLASFIGGILLVADLIFLNNIVVAESTTGEIRGVVNQVLEERFDNRFLSMMAPCDFDDSKKLQAEFASLLDADDPVMGNPDSRIIVMDIFDPNCPHCKETHEIMKPVIQRFGDRVAFRYKPFPLWEKSVNQVEAIWLANDQDRFFHMIDIQFHNQYDKDLNNEALFQLSDAIGMNTPQFRKDLQGRKYLDKVIEFRGRLNAAGITSAPIILINGKFVGKKGQTLTTECISTLIEQELQSTGSQ